MGPALPPRAGQWPRLPEYPDSGSVSRKSKQTTTPLPNESRPPESNVASATSSRSAGVSDATSFRHFMNRGRAYREQATTLIEICRLYQPPTYTESDAFQNVLRLADAALSAALMANSGTTTEAADAFLRVREEMLLYSSPPPRQDSDAPEDHRRRLPDANIALAAAWEKDERSIRVLSQVESEFPTRVSKGPIMKVVFAILKSPHEGHHNILSHEEIDNSTTASEIIWRNCRYPEGSPWRISLKQNPHFYLELSDDAASYGSDFYKDPSNDFTANAHPYRTSTFYVLSDKSCLLYLDAAPPHRPRIFSNLWRPHGTIILKDVSGVLVSEDIIPRSIGEDQDYWYRPSKVVDPSQLSVELGHSGVDNIIVQQSVGNWRAVIELALVSQNIDLMIRDRSMPEPPEEWKRLPSDTYPHLHVEIPNTPQIAIPSPEREQKGQGQS